MKRLKSVTRYRIADACLRLPTTEKADIDFITKTKKKIVFLFCWCVVHLFSSRKSLVWIANKQTNRKLKNYPSIKNSVRRAAKISSIRSANVSFNCSGVPHLRARKFFSNRNVTLHARSLGPLWIRSFVWRSKRAKRSFTQTAETTAQVGCRKLRYTWMFVSTLPDFAFFKYSSCFL